MREGATSLSISALDAYYGESHVLHDVSLDVRPGEVVALIGRNGAGKTTTLRSIIGLVAHRTGSIRLADRETIASQPEEIARLGVGYVPEERGIYASLDVMDNLLLPRRIDATGLSLDAIFELFPNLRERRRSQGTKLSGGEQQMLAIARVLRTGAKLFLLDEPTEGLAPVVVAQIGRAIERIRADGHTLVLVEQNFRFVSRLADRHYVLESGRVVDMIERADVEAAKAKIASYLGV